jgi:phosphate/sulfate permease
MLLPQLLQTVVFSIFIVPSLLQHSTTTSSISSSSSSSLSLSAVGLAVAQGDSDFNVSTWRSYGNYLLQPWFAKIADVCHPYTLYLQYILSVSFVIIPLESQSLRVWC